ncbi:LicD family protein [Limosilactobacillus pontis]|uniref:LicD family protein n=1 Tax=Limosilactobacillus pontis TaxID=35787 RepID=A0ABU7SU36_9LACO
MQIIKSVRERQKILLNILIYADKVMTENNINYSLAYGSLIGAARHKGFIPWDDDLDIVVPYKDYLKLLNLPELNNHSDHYSIYFSKNDDNYAYPFAKIEDNETRCCYYHVLDSGGAFLDVFPMTPAPIANLHNYSKYLTKNHNKLAFANSKSDNPVKNVIHKMARPKYKKYRNRMIEEVFKYCNMKDYNYLIDGTWSDNREKEYVPQKWFKDYRRIEFEGHDFKVITHYKDWLELIYGDWQKMPPKGERIGHHYFDLYKL